VAVLIGLSSWFPSLEVAQAFTILYVLWPVLEVLNHIIGRGKSGRR
jgi:protein-S-isoprenylcysteine O-methyltransferase Ste14